MKIGKLLFLRYVSFGAAVSIMVFIFCMSAENSTQSSHSSGNLISMLAKIFNKDFLDMSLEQQADYIEMFQLFVRKAAHFTIYSLLGFCLSVGMLTYKRLLVYCRCLFAFLVAVVYAATDEIHQLFVPGRSGEFRDWLIDIVGAFLGCSLVFIIGYLINNKKSLQR